MTIGELQQKLALMISAGVHPNTPVRAIDGSEVSWVHCSGPEIVIKLQPER